MILLLSTAWAVDFSHIGEYRVVFSLPPDLVVDSEGTRVGQAWAADQRLRLGIDATATGWHAGTEWDVFNGQFIGDTWDIPDTEDERHREALQSLTPAGIRPRRAVFGLDLPVGQLDLGLQTSKWGLGLVANDGAQDPLFGRSDFGDRVIRARFGTHPLPSLTVVAAADLVAADDTADLLQHQAAIQGVVATVWHPESLQLGLYGVYRHQIEGAFQDLSPQEHSDLGVLDFYGHYVAAPAEWNLDIGAEAAGIYGWTGRARSYNSPAGLEVLSGGTAVKITMDEPAGRFGAFLGGGFLSGDANPDDGATHAFTADRDFNVGMVLFDEVQGDIDAATYAQLSDPRYSGQPPDGADLVVSEGAARGATWVQPAIIVTPVAWLQARVGAVTAWSTAPVSQSFQTFRHGGVPTNHLGQATSGYSLGTELDWALSLGERAPLGPVPLLSHTPLYTLTVQGGHAWLSSDLGGGRADMIMLSGRIRL